MGSGVVLVIRAVRMGVGTKLIRQKHCRQLTNRTNAIDNMMSATATVETAALARLFVLLIVPLLTSARDVLRIAIGSFQNALLPYVEILLII
jgi:hypothetical protein